MLCMESIVLERTFKGSTMFKILGVSKDFYLENVGSFDMTLATKSVLSREAREVRTTR